MSPSFLAHNLRFYRQQCELSQADLAARAGDPLTQAYISLLERGYRPRSQSHVDQLASALGVRARALLARPRPVRRPVIIGARSAGVA